MLWLRRPDALIPTLSLLGYLLHDCLDLFAPYYLPERRHLRWRNLCILAVLFGVLWYVSPLAAIGCAIADGVSFLVGV